MAKGCEMQSKIKEKPTALYRQYDAQGNLLYVGIALSVQSRTLMHKSCSPWLNSVTRIEIEWYPDRSSAMDAESIAISSESPKYNTLKMASRLKKMVKPMPDAPTPKSDCVNNDLSSKRTQLERRAADRLHLVDVRRGLFTAEQARQIEAWRAENNAAIAATSISAATAGKDEE
jgi:hypothetical protein